MAVMVERLIDQRVSTGLCADTLFTITDPKTTLAIWQRELTDSLKNIANRISQQPLDFVITLDLFDEAEQAIFGHKFESLTGGKIDPLANDILDLSQQFATVCMQKVIRIRVETVTDDGCRFFHVDNVPLRLVVTYAGAGTQWVLPAYAPMARDQQEAYIGPLNSIRTGDISLFRGKKSGLEDLILHRSPPLEPSDSPRLVVVIDSA